MNREKLSAWLVHLYTASGGVLGMFALFAAANDKTSEAFLLLIVTMLIDSTDGIMARRLRVSEVLPDFSGARMDDAIDTLTFIWIGLFIIWRENLLPHPAWLIPPILAGLYAYGQINMKSEDSFFIGFPSYWSTVALYLYWLRPDAVFSVLLVLIPSILSFIPTRYLYPSKNTIYWKTSWALGAVWFFLIIYLLLQDEPSKTLVWISTFYPIYYLVVSFYIDFKLRYGGSLE